MTDTEPVPGQYTDNWKLKAENFKCRKCGSDDIWFREWESSCGGYDDVHYECRGCKLTWWVEGADS